MLPASQRGLPVHASASQFVFETTAKPKAERTLWRPASAARAAAPAARMAPPCPAAATRSASAPPRARRPRSGSTAHIRATCGQHLGSDAGPKAAHSLALFNNGSLAPRMTRCICTWRCCPDAAHEHTAALEVAHRSGASCKGEVRKGVLTRGSNVPTPPSCRWSGVKE